MEERRRAHRYRLDLQVSIKPKSGYHQAEPIFGTTLDISTNGFYCRTTRKLNVGARFRFSITLPRRGAETEQGFVNGEAVAVRVERRTDNRFEFVGIGAAIETYKIVQRG